MIDKINDMLAGNPPAESPQAKSATSSKLLPGVVKPPTEELLLEWMAPSRLFKKRDRQFFVTIIIIATLLALILFFIGQFLPIAVIASIVFVTYVFSSIPPDYITLSITTYGLRIDGELYFWEELGRYWFETKYNQKILKIETIAFPGRLNMILNEEEVPESDIRAILDQALINQKPAPTFYEQAADWIQKKIPLEKD